MMQELQKKETPKRRCPYCGRRLLYGKRKEVLQIISVCKADNPKAETYIQCTRCGKELGLQVQEISQ